MALHSSIDPTSAGPNVQVKRDFRMSQPLRHISKSSSRTSSRASRIRGVADRRSSTAGTPGFVDPSKERVFHFAPFTLGFFCI